MRKTLVLLATLICSAQSTFAAPETFSPLSPESGSLSNSDRKFTSSGASGNAMIATPLTAGKYYFEGQQNLTNDNSGVGLNVFPVCPGYLGTNIYSIGFFKYSSGSIYYNATMQKSSIGTNDTAVVWRYAVDMDNKTFWVAKAAGNWNNSGTADPATNTGGVSFSSAASDEMWFTVCLKSSGEYFDGNFGNAAFTYSVPSGFTSGIPISGTLPDSTNFASVPQATRSVFTNYPGYYAVSKFTIPSNLSITTMDFVLPGSADAVTGEKLYAVVLADNAGSPATGQPQCKSAKNTTVVNGINTLTFSSCSLLAGDWWVGYAYTVSSGNHSGQGTTAFTNSTHYVLLADADALPDSPTWNTQTKSLQFNVYTGPYSNSFTRPMIFGASNNFPGWRNAVDRCEAV